MDFNFNRNSSTVGNGVRESDASSNPAYFMKNDFYSINTGSSTAALYVDYTTVSVYVDDIDTTAVSIGSPATSHTLNYWNNMWVAPQFVKETTPTNYHLQAGSPVESSGDDLSSTGFSNDKDKRTRGVGGTGWSLGAYEK